MGAENKESCSQRDSAERKGYVRAHRSFNRIWKERDSAEPDIPGKILKAQPEQSLQKSSGNKERRNRWNDSRSGTAVAGRKTTTS